MITSKDTRRHNRGGRPRETFPCRHWQDDHGLAFLVPDHDLPVTETTRIPKKIRLLTCDLSSRCRLRGCHAGLVQTRFAAIRGVAMNDPALGRFIDGGDQRAFCLLIFLAGVARDGFVHLPQASEDATITERAHCGLARAFGGGFGIGHGKIFWAGRVGARRPLVNLRISAGGSPKEERERS